MSGDGPVAIVTGGGWNIGRTTAIDLARRGWRVVVVARTAARLDETAALVRDAGGTALVHATDLRDAAGADAMAQATRDAFGRIDAVVNFAGGFGAEGRLDVVDPAAWVDVVERNVFATFHATRAALPALRDAPAGHVVTCAGAGAFFPQLGWPITAYATAKAALCRFTDQLAAELLDTAVRVNCVEPGMVWDPPTLARIEAEERESGTPHPDREHNRPPEAAAELVAWLLSDAARGVTGRLVSVNDPWWRDPDAVGAVIDSDAYRLRRSAP